MQLSEFPDAGKPTASPEEKIFLRRFGASEIALHWSVVAPYLALAASGVLLILKKNLAVEPIASATLVKIHLGAGAALLALPVLVLIASPPGRILRTLLDALRFGWRDVVWLHLSPLRLIFPRLILAEEGRFNAGQKLNLLHVAFLVPAIAATGAILWANGGASLTIRTLHAGGAALSIVLSLGHIYLALIHPPTRKAVGGIFHGKIDGAYAAAHHPRWYRESTGLIPPPREPPAGPFVRWDLLGILGAALVLGSVLAIEAKRDGGPLRKGIETKLTPYLAEPRKLLEPAPLHPVHRTLPEAGRCASCHASAARESDRLCLDCHPEIADRLKSGRGYHGKLLGACSECHAEHRETLIDLRDDEFAHRQAAFALEGAHEKLPCDVCHGNAGGKTRKYLGLAHDACDACHADPHRPNLGRPCDACHAEESWEKLKDCFDHDLDTEFPLASFHRAAACGECHGPRVGFLPAAGPFASTAPVLRGTPRECKDCHKDVASALDGALGSEPGGLASSHAGRVECIECHEETSGKGPRDCRRCHPRDYDSLFVEWQARVEIELLARPAAARKSLLRLGRHNWEALVESLRL